MMGKGMRSLAVHMGHEWPETIGHPWAYFERRGCVIDCRGPLSIARSSYWGFGVKVLTQSHDISEGPGQLGPVVARGVQVDGGVWVGSFSVLIGCHIGEGAVVAAGTVVRCQDVEPCAMVAGNPAQVIARWDGGQWVYEAPEVSQFYRRLS